ncbi:CDP-glucose 4,6-dehydratase [Clostridium gasigenes]|uniref:CDP-glucose 4,6-dehydratase n=1 Tax=Clostridium gasigenes TaxID=94869 RepID=UPI001C0C8AFF|nr:CDP-glucose 4,6-dehydratase [Clostridium gasigenes]MBU3130858.1 CDP-glucose 4,6-dehydratase [Clostridium gasigenes]
MSVTSNIIKEKNFWYGKIVLITGHTGFKGSWLSIWLTLLGAKVIGFSLEESNPLSIFEKAKLSDKVIDTRGDIRDLIKLKDVFNKYNPEIVFHLAAQALVRESYKNPSYTYEVNVNGTMNVLECIRGSKNPITVVLITTDKCYENKEIMWGYRENDALGGYDPYSSSKACCEILISSWRNSFFNPSQYTNHKKSIASARAGNVIGGGDFAKDRIVPDSIRALEENKKIKIRNPKSTRPWQHVLEPLFGYMVLAKKMYENPLDYCEGWNFGPNINSVIDVKSLTEKLVYLYGMKDMIEIEKNNDLHEANLLFLDTTKSRLKLNWQGKLDIDKTLNLTIDWYKRYKSEDVFTLCSEQIQYYMKIIGE